MVAWNWGRGWLYVLGFHDFAGATTVHVVGGTAALWGAVILGERYLSVFLIFLANGEWLISGY